MINLDQYIINGELRIHAKPNSKKTLITGFDDARKIVLVDVAARPEDNKANLEIVKFFSKQLKRRVLIKSGATSKNKVLKMV